METVARPSHLLMPCRSAIQHRRGSPDRQNILKEAPLKTVVARWFRAWLTRQAVSRFVDQRGITAMLGLPGQLILACTAKLKPWRTWESISDALISMMFAG